MKKLLNPEIEFVKFDTEDVITTSSERYRMKWDQYSSYDQSPVTEDGYGGLSWNQTF